MYSTAELLENISYQHSQKLYRYNIELWEKQIESYKLQAKLHEIAEIYLRIADIHETKLNDTSARDENIRKSITYLKQESNLLKEFDEFRKLAQNYQHVADLFFKLNDNEKAITYYKKVITLSKKFNFFDLLSFSYQQIAQNYRKLENYKKAKDIILDGITCFIELSKEFENTNNNLILAQIYQILKKLCKIIKDKECYTKYAKKEASAYINLAETLKREENNYYKIARYYRGAGLCYKEINYNLIESASCFLLAGNYYEKIKDYHNAAINFFDAALVFKELKNHEMVYKNFIKAGDNFFKINNMALFTESYLNAYDTAMEANLEFNRYGIFNQIIRGLSYMAKEGLKNKQFFMAATLILESIKFYEQLETAKDFLLREMVRNVYRYYYKAANLKKIGYSHIVQSYILASISCILTGKIEKARKILNELDSDGVIVVEQYKTLINIIIDKITKGEQVELNSFPFHIRRLIEGSEEVLFLLKLFKGFKIENYNS
ncbi:MAG: hypothetical protein ACTSU4_07205 [Promethearchaeota archaeon]